MDRVWKTYGSAADLSYRFYLPANILGEGPGGADSPSRRYSAATALGSASATMSNMIRFSSKSLGV
jgi:hypothetical protein